MRQYYVDVPNLGLKTFAFETVQGVTIEDLKFEIEQQIGILSSDFQLMFKSLVLKAEHPLEELPNIHKLELHIGLRGGKGGFGALMRSQASTRKKITNFDSSRDLQGRRIRNVNYYKKMLEWLRKKKEEDEKISEELKEFKKQQRMQKAAERDVKLTQEFKSKLEKWDSEMSKSIMQGLKKKKQKQGNGENDPAKETTEEPKKPAEKKKIDLDLTKTLNVLLEELKSDETESPAENNKKEEPLTKTAVVQEEQPKVQKETKETKEFPEIKLESIQSLDELLKYDPEHLKADLAKRGLKCGGSPQERAKRLWDVKCDPSKLNDPKYKAKK